MRDAGIAYLILGQPLAPSRGGERVIVIEQSPDLIRHADGVYLRGSPGA